MEEETKIQIKGKRENKEGKMKGKIQRKAEWKEGAKEGNEKKMSEWMNERTKGKTNKKKKGKRTKSTSRTRLSIFPYHRKYLRISSHQIIAFLTASNFRTYRKNQDTRRRRQAWGKQQSNEVQICTNRVPYIGTHLLIYVALTRNFELQLYSSYETEAGWGGGVLCVVPFGKLTQRVKPVLRPHADLHLNLR